MHEAVWAWTHNMREQMVPGVFRRTARVSPELALEGRMCEFNAGEFNATSNAGMASAERCARTPCRQRGGRVIRWKWGMTSHVT
eukprot:5910611-Prymnesium_polylepis.1